MAKAIKCPHCGGVNTELGEYQLVSWRRLPLNDESNHAGDYSSDCFDEAVFNEVAESTMNEHWFCNDCFCEVEVSSPDAKNWVAVDVDLDAWRRGDLDNPNAIHEV